MLHEERSQVTIFTEREQVLLVQSVDVTFGVVVDDTVGDNDRFDESMIPLKKFSGKCNRGL